MHHSRFVLAVLLAGCMFVQTDPLTAQGAVLRGTVTDSATQAPLQSALVTVAGTDRRAETNSAGEYRLVGLTPGELTVRVQMIGYNFADRQLVIGPGETIADFTLTAGVTQLEDVVSVGYGRVNIILEKVPALTDLEDEEKNQALGEAHVLRALHYHNLVKLYGDVPLRLTSPQTVEEAAQITRSPAADVYAQILADLAEAETQVTATEPTTQVTAGAVDALQARVQFYRGDYAAAIAEADEVIDAGYELASDYADLFDAEGQDTPEDILKVIFTAQQFTNIGFYYISADEGGRGEIAPDQNLIDAYDPDDARLAWSIFVNDDDVVSGVKFPTTFGAEDFHVIRFAEVLLIKAEAQARLDDLAGAVETYNQIRERAELPAHSLGDEVTTQADVLAAIDLERRLELAFEGDRWADLVRTGQAAAVLAIPAFQTLYPIPQQETVVAPGITQNPGY